MSKTNVVFQTDFGRGGSGAMWGVSKQVCENLQLYDISHLIPTFNVKRASSSLRDNMLFWPKGTVFVSVVDPGVGTARRASIAKTSNGYYISTPDNGTLTYIKEEFGIDEIRVIDEKVNRYRGTEKTSIFHGRDLFAYCAAKLAAGVISFEEVGPAYSVDEIVCFETAENIVRENYIKTSVDSTDHFGNVVTTLNVNKFNASGIKLGDEVEVTVTTNGKIAAKEITKYTGSFAERELGESLVYPNFNCMISLSVNRGSFAEEFNVIEDNSIIEIAKVVK